ncbi:hypothetical protein QBC47DRAFT_418768 [Echria macrotheca]|uniref:Uncharacterized protein n=1 Tax=Echria macrotheca TaxID=438768 RepID=A0AAJ0B182_9PEZI|nr:hypothetical protein QBC47DRAFT_418768 [Echria macrotheca]
MYGNFLVATFALLLAGSAQADVIRVNDLVVVDGLSLKVDPAGGFNDTTRHLAWQISYIGTLSPSKVEEVYQGAIQGALRPRDALQIQAGADCLKCMVNEIDIFWFTTLRKSRTEAYNDCAAQCTTLSLNSIRNNLKAYWTIAGIGAYAVGNHLYDEFMATPW